MQCDLCGKKESRYHTKIEGTIMNVCEDCSSFGERISRIKKEIPKETKTFRSAPSVEEEEVIQIITKGYPSLVKNARERKGMKQEDYAKSINEKVSVIHNIESGRSEPNIPLAEKIQKSLGIKIIEDYVRKSIPVPDRSESADLTIGSVVNIKHRKKS